MVKKNNLNNLLLVILIFIVSVVFLKNIYYEILLRYLNNPHFFEVFFSDFYLIYAGSEILNQDKNPYLEWLELHNTPFFNPPIVFQLFKFIANYNYYSVASFWFFISLISYFFIPLILFKIYRIHFKYFIIFLISFGGISLSVFFTGNISIFLTALFALSLFFLNKGKDHFFYLILSILSLIKFPYLIFFGLPILIKKINFKLFINLFIYLTIIIFIYLALSVIDKELFASWINSLKFSKFIGDNGDFGRGLFKILSNFFLPNSFSIYFFYFFIFTILFTFILFIFKNSNLLNKENNKDLAIALGIIVLSMLLPRLKSYDLLITIPSVFFIIQTLNFKSSKMINSILKFTLFLLLLGWTSPYAPISLFCTIVILISLDLKFGFIERK